MSSRHTVARAAFTLIVVGVLAIQVYPILWVFLTSLRPQAEFAEGNPFSLPTSLTLENYTRALEKGNLRLYIKNSLVVTSLSCAAIVVLSLMASYAIEVLRFRFRNAVLAFFLSGIIVPAQVALIPLFLTYRSMGILNSYLSLIIPAVGFALPISIYLFVSFLKFIPKETIEAAVLDGVNAYSLFFKIVLPMSINTITTVVFVNGTFIWNDFIFANTFVLKNALKTVPLGLQDYVGQMGATDWTATFAAVSITILPILLVFFALNRTIIRGLESGATKG
ncbi:carbohydrate ABC transporter permease [Geochorda subterranea]|uniref:Carbohydrate ABC transporter permease n=1 Tax=Geochorda subterranea TaxID=3109564 RepID=A0ABZ1BQZ5_9FIRM|nr:carbohydrate ABC transporter permease [Limnochorda sp. LNt]WRP14542.1 carbohydrate ABC transporter permease [Limnochorda sp. LNt]